MEARLLNDRKEATKQLANYSTFLRPDEIAAILNVSVTTVTRQFALLDGVIDLGTPTSCHKRRKRILRIPHATFERYLAERKVQGRRRKGQ
jgi:transcriptional antiterminator